MINTNPSSGINHQTHTKNPIFHPQTQRNTNIPVDFQPPNKPSQQICRLFVSGKCYHGNCKYLHIYPSRSLELHEMGESFEGQRMENEVVKYCRWTFETCPYGQNCHFVHKFEEYSKRVVEGVDDVIVLGGQARRVQEFDEFKFRERKWKTKLCHKFERYGSCPHGGDCRFAHGKEELKRIGPERNAFAANLPATLPKNCPSRRTGFSSSRLEMKRKKSWFNWDVEKISRIYADWIEKKEELVQLD